MKTRFPSIALALVAILGFSVPAQAAKGGKAGQRRGQGSMLAHFDKNRDGSIDSTEAEAVRKAFQALKALDADNNGELSDSEIAAAKIGKAGKGKKAGKANKAGKKAGNGKGKKAGK